MAWLINASQLDKFRKVPKNVVIFDASYHSSTSQRDARQEFLQSHIASAKFFDLTNFNDTQSNLANMLLRDEVAIAERLGDLGITNEHKIIFYDDSELHSSCRAVWMMQAFGHNSSLLYMLDGGFAAWKRYGGKIEEGYKAPNPTAYQVNFHANSIRTLIQMKTNLHHPSEQVVDTRHPVRFAGGKEPNDHLRTGHIPGSFPFPYFTMFEKDGRFKSIEKIRKQLNGLGIDLDFPIVTTSGSGITAAILNFQLELMNHGSHSLYDGSWNEWGATTVYPGEEGLNERPVIKSTDS